MVPHLSTTLIKEKFSGPNCPRMSRTTYFRPKTLQAKFHTCPETPAHHFPFGKLNPRGDLGLEKSGWSGAPTPPTSNLLLGRWAVLSQKRWQTLPIILFPDQRWHPEALRNNIQRLTLIQRRLTGASCPPCPPLIHRAWLQPKGSFLPKGEAGEKLNRGFNCNPTFLRKEMLHIPPQNRPLFGS